MPDRVWTPGGRRLMFDCCAVNDSKEAVGEVGLLSPCTDLGQLLPLNSWLLEGEVRSSQTSIGDRHGSQRGEVDREDQGQESWLEGRLCWWKSSAQVCICIIFFFFLCETDLSLYPLHSFHTRLPQWEREEPIEGAKQQQISESEQRKPKQERYSHHSEPSQSKAGVRIINCLVQPPNKC